MDSEQLAELIRRQIDDYHYHTVPGLVGHPWPADKVSNTIAALRQALVKPYRERFELRETLDQVQAESPHFASYWVVAEGDVGYVLWYDPSREEFGLAVRNKSGIPISIGVYGDVVGTFMAM